MEKEILLYWEEPKQNRAQRKFFKTIWDARIFANSLDTDCKNIRIYKLEEEYEEE